MEIFINWVFNFPEVIDTIKKMNPFFMGGGQTQSTFQNNLNKVYVPVLNKKQQYRKSFMYIFEE